MHKQFYFLFLILLCACNGNQTESSTTSGDSSAVSKDSVVEKTPEPTSETMKEENYPPFGDSLTHVYLSELPSLPLPFKISTQHILPPTNTDHITKDITELTIHMGHPYGKLMEENLYAVVVHTLPADAMMLPVIYTIDYNGKIIDHLNAFEFAGEEADFKTWEHFSITKDRLIEFVDSSYTYKTLPSGERIEGMEKLDVTYKQYIITDKGFFEEPRELD